MHSPNPVVFLAGRIRPEQLRFGLAPCGLHGVSDLDAAPLRPFTFHSSSYLYAGPYVFGCENQQQQAPTMSQSEEQIERQQQFGHTFKRTLDGLQKASHFFVWVEDEECFGTLWELGYLYGLGKRVYLAHSASVHPAGNLWFSFQGLTEHYKCDTVEEALEWFFKKVDASSI